MIAIQYDKMEIVNYLLDFDKIHFDHVNDKGVTALLLACSGNQIQILSIVIIFSFRILITR